MNGVLKEIIDLIQINEKYREFKIVHTDNGEIRIVYKTYIIIVRYEGDNILFVNGFKTFEKYVMDKFENGDFYNQPWYLNHYNHHDSHDCHCHGYYRQTIPACSRDYHFNSDVMKRPHPEITLLHATLEDYRDYIKNDLVYVQTVIDLIDQIISMR